MRPITAWLLGSLGALWVVAPTPGNAAMFRQNFEITVTSISPASLDPPILDDPRFPAAQKLFPVLNPLPVPPIGTKGIGSYTYDDSELNYVDQPRTYPVSYYLGSPGKIAFSNFSLNFFDHTYTERTYVGTRIGEFFTYTRTPTGQYLPASLDLRTFNDTSVLSIIGGGGNFFTYRPGPTDLLVSSGYVNSVSGTLRFTDAEPVPEPPSSAITPILALGLGWLFHCKRTARKSF